MNKIKIAVFDMAGTTVDEGKVVYESVGKALQSVGIHLATREIFQKIGGHNKIDAIEMLMHENQHQDPTSIFEVQELFKRILMESYASNDAIKEINGASEVFEQLRENGIKVTLNTGYTREIASYLISKMGWDQQGLIDFFVTSEEVAQGRPASLMIEKIMAHFEVSDPREVAKIGDTKADIEEGLNAECQFVVGITSKYFSREDLLGHGATHAIEELAELTDILY